MHFLSFMITLNGCLRITKHCKQAVKLRKPFGCWWSCPRWFGRGWWNRSWGWFRSVDWSPSHFTVLGFVKLLFFMFWTRKSSRNAWLVEFFYLSLRWRRRNGHFSWSPCSASPLCRIGRGMSLCLRWKCLLEILQKIVWRIKHPRWSEKWYNYSSEYNRKY